MSELVFHRRGEELMRVSLDRPQTTLGRGGQNDIALPDVAVSRAQLLIEQRGTRHVLLDASGRGTRVGGRAQQEVELRDGSEIDLGEWRAVYRTSTDPVSEPTAAGRGLTQHQDRAETNLEGPVQLRVRTGGREQVLKLTSDELSIGKDSENQLVLEDPFISSFHIQLTRTRRGFWLRDLGSTNGTFLNGSRVREAEVPLGSLLRLGETELTLERPPSGVPTSSFEGLVGRDPGLVQIFDLVDRVAPSPVAVTVFGETGTGKELVARALHSRSLRRDRPFVPVNCAALHKELIESELFGHEKGAFTGADRARAGAFEEASSGSLFLDEIGELSLDLQAKLLRVLESGELRRLGSSKTIQVDVRVIAATHRDLFTRARQGLFREDLYYRLCVFPLILPPLRRRPSDLGLLAEHFLRRFGPPGHSIHLSKAAHTKLAAHPFPGNIRELRNVIQRALLHRSSETIAPDDIRFDTPLPSSEAPDPGTADDDEYLALRGRTLASVIDEARKRAIRRHDGNKSQAALELGVSRSTLTPIDAQAKPPASSD